MDVVYAERWVEEEVRQYGYDQWGRLVVYTYRRRVFERVPMQLLPPSGGPTTGDRISRMAGNLIGGLLG